MQLDPQQHAAATTDSRKALVLAGAGAGKTRTLVERVAYLVEEQRVSPYEILCITFTRKAAGEMRERLEQRIGREAYKLTIGTIHSVALNLLRRFGDWVELRPGQLTVYGPADEEDLLKDVAHDLGLYGKSWKKIKKREINSCFNAFYQKGEEPAEEDPANDLFRAFIARCHENNALTFGSLVIGMRLLIPRIAQYLQWSHVLVDEVQDNDPLQWAIVEMLRKHLDVALFCVGDVDQSIFAFRGAVPGYLIEHQHEFDLYRIENNYRSDAEIVQAANALIELNANRLPKTMRSTRGDVLSIYDGVRVRKNLDSAALAAVISNLSIIERAEAFANAGDMDSAYGDIAVLARNHRLLEKLEEELTALNVPVVRIGKNSALTRSEEFRRLHAFLKLRVNPFDNWSFMLIRHIIGLDAEAYAAVRLRAVEGVTSHFQAWMATTEDNDIYKMFFALEDGNGSALSNMLDLLIVDILSGNGLDKDQLDEAVQFLKDWQDANPRSSLADYLQWLATYDIQDELKQREQDNAVTLMTIHAAKGLEWPCVIVAGVNEGTLPSKQSATDPDELESERRLAYVAFTRAESTLVLAVRPETKTYGETVYHTPMSRFVVEAGLEKTKEHIHALP